VAQEAPVVAIDFSILAEHDPLAEEPSGVGRHEQVPARRRSARVGVRSDEPVEEVPTDGATAEPLITENRAVWVEGGYLVLIQWTRPESAEEAIAALEASSPDILAYLGTLDASSAVLHDPGPLHVLETGLIALLSPIVAPATIDVIHLDHDCQTLCTGGVSPDLSTPIRVRGRMVTPSTR
jgi:hypothetical protein